MCEFCGIAIFPFFLAYLPSYQSITGNAIILMAQNVLQKGAIKMMALPKQPCGGDHYSSLVPLQPVIHYFTALLAFQINLARD